MDYSAPYQKIFQSFVVRNIAVPKKTIRIFHYPIEQYETRDLLAIPGVSEASLRASLLKGEVNHKIRANEIVVVSSDIDLLQYNDEQRAFLVSAGIHVSNTTVGPTQFSNSRREDITLLGTVDGTNTDFTIPNGEKFVQDNNYRIIPYVNGVKQYYIDDYSVIESGGPGTGYDTVRFTQAPLATPLPIDIVTADYYVLVAV